jgi:hypothetical protein
MVVIRLFLAMAILDRGDQCRIEVSEHATVIEHDPEALCDGKQARIAEPDILPP